MVDVKKLRRNDLVFFTPDKNERFHDFGAVVNKVIGDRVLLHWNEAIYAVDVMVLIDNKYLFPFPLSDSYLSNFKFKEGVLKKEKEGVYLYKGKEVTCMHELQNAIFDDTGENIVCFEEKEIEL